MKMSGRYFYGLALLGTVALGCNRSRTVPPDPGGLPPVPASARGTDPASLTHAPQEAPIPADPPMPADHPAMPANHPPVIEGARPAPAEEAPTVPDLSKTLSGRLTLSPKVKDKVAPGATIFLVARGYQAGGPGPVLAVKKLNAESWPIHFELSGADVMMEGMSLNGKVVITARVDQDGDAMTKQAGDVEGVSKPIDVPAKNIDLLLDTIRTESSGAPSPQGMGMPAGHP